MEDLAGMRCINDVNMDNMDETHQGRHLLNKISQYLMRKIEKTV